MTLVSVIIPTYNHSQFILDAINSIMNQTYSDWECIIVDDGSTDDTQTVVGPLLELGYDIKYFKKENGGLSSARNFGIKKSQGTYILPLDADDTFEKTFLEKAVEKFSRDGALKVVYCEARYFGAKQGKWNLPEYSNERLLVSNMIFSCAMFKREDYNRVNGYDESILYEDWDFWLRILNDGGNVFRIPEVLFNYRKHIDGSLMNDLSKKNEKHFFSMDIIYSKNEERFKKVYGNPINIELQRQKLERSLNHRLHQFVEKNKKSLIARILLKLLK